MRGGGQAGRKGRGRMRKMEGAPGCYERGLTRGKGEGEVRADLWLREGEEQRGRAKG